MTPPSDDQRVADELNKLRDRFPHLGFVVAVVNLEDKNIWGWTNLVDPKPAAAWLAQQEGVTVRNPSRN